MSRFFLWAMPDVGSSKTVDACPVPSLVFCHRAPHTCGIGWVKSESHVAPPSFISALSFLLSLHDLVASALVLHNESDILIPTKQVVTDNGSAAFLLILATRHVRLFLGSRGTISDPAEAQHSGQQLFQLRGRAAALSGSSFALSEQMWAGPQRRTTTTLGFRACFLHSQHSTLVHRSRRGSHQAQKSHTSCTR